MSEDPRNPPDSSADGLASDGDGRDGPHRARHVATPFAGGSERADDTGDGTVAVLPATLLDRYRRFSLYNSPYAAHDEGCAVDLYPERGTAPSPVAGEVTTVRSVSAPPKPYAADEDHLIVVATDDTRDATADGLLTPPDARVRVMHVDPDVAVGDRVAVGDSLGETVRSGFFAPWVGDHIHVGVRPPDANPLRATGSMPMALGPDVALAALPWDGRGRVVETGDCYVALDAPAHPAAGDRLAGIAAGVGGPVGTDGATTALADGGLVHYDGGGVFPTEGTERSLAGDPVFVAGRRVGTVAPDGRTVAWRDLTVTLDGDPVTGVSLYAGHDHAGAKVVGPDLAAAVGDEVRVELVPPGETA